MSACDRRTYYPTTNGLFKLRASDGDLAWESRAVSPLGVAVPATVNTNVDRLPGGSLIVSGAERIGNGIITNSGLLVDESGGLVSAVTQVGPGLSQINDDASLLMYDRNDDYFYLCGFSGVFVPSAVYVINKFLHDGTFVGERLLNNFLGHHFRALEGDEFDVRQGTGVTVFVRRFPGLTGAFTASSDAMGEFFMDHYHRLLSDGSSYFASVSSASIVRVNAATLATATTQSVAPRVVIGTEAATRDGLLIHVERASGVVIHVVLRDATSLALIWNCSLGTNARVIDLGVCASYAVVARAGSDVNHCVVARIDAGAVSWQATLRSASTLDTQDHRNVSVVISRDESKVYVWGAFTLEPFLSTGMQLSLYCLNATDGSVLWCFSAGPTIDFWGSNDQGGCSLYDDGAYVYLGTTRCRAPTYR